MGLFDTFYFKDYKLDAKLFHKLGELTLDDIQDSDYQTKDLEETFNGYFYLDKCDHPCPARDYNGNPFPDQTYFRLMHHTISCDWIATPGDRQLFGGFLKQVGSEEVPVEMGTETVSVYTSFQRENFDYWVEFDLIFISGELRNVHLFKFTETPNGDRKLQDQEVQDMMKRHQEYAASPMGKIHLAIRRAYNKVLRRPQVVVGDFLVKIAYAFRNFSI